MKTTSYTERWSPMWRDLSIDLISRPAIARWTPVPLRLIVGYGFHGAWLRHWPMGVRPLAIAV